MYKRKYKFPEWQLLTTSIIIYHIPVEFSNLIACVLDWLLYILKMDISAHIRCKIYRPVNDTIKQSISELLVNNLNILKNSIPQSTGITGSNIIYLNK